MTDKRRPSAHAITITPREGRVAVKFAGRIIADTSRALALKEGALPVVYYVPRNDVRMELLEATEHTSHCPFKGDATYFSLKVDDTEAENAVWCYETPKDEVGSIAGRLAFDPAKVDAISVENAGEG